MLTLVEWVMQGGINLIFLCFTLDELNLLLQVRYVIVKIINNILHSLNFFFHNSGSYSFQDVTDLFHFARDKIHR